MSYKTNHEKRQEATRLKRFIEAGEASYKRFQTGGYGSKPSAKCDSRSSERSKHAEAPLGGDGLLERLAEEIGVAVSVLVSPMMGLKRSDAERLANAAVLRREARKVEDIVKQALNLYNIERKR